MAEGKKKKLLDNKVVKAGSWYIITEFFLKGLTFLTIPIFTRLLSTSDYGFASLYTTWVGIFTILIGLNLNTSITKGIYDFKEDYDKFVASIILLSLIILSGYIAIFTIFKNQIQSITGFRGFVLYFMIFQAYFSFIRNCLITKFRVEYKYKKISVLSIIMSVTGIILSILLIHYVFKDEAYMGKIIGNGILIVIFGTFFLIYLLKNGKGKLVNINYWKYALILSLPMVFHSLSNVVNAQFDRIVINRYVGESSTGLYSFAYNIGMIIAVLTLSLDQAWSPWVYETMQNGESYKIKSRAELYRNFYTLFYALLLFASPELIKIMVDSSYWESLVIIPYIFAGYYLSFMYTLEVKTEFFYRKTSLISVGTVLSAIINIILNIVFVPIYGYIAAAITTTISYLALFVFHYLITSRIIRKNIYGIKFHLKSLLYMIVITIYYMYFIKSIMMRIVGILVVLAMVYWLLKYKYISRKESE